MSNTEDSGEPFFRSSSVNDPVSPTATAGRFLNIVGAVSNLVNTVIGAGIVILPITFHLGGVYFGIFISLLCVLFVVYTSDLMIITALRLEKKENKPVLSYPELCERTVGPVGYYFLATVTFLIVFFGLCVYGVLLKQMIGSIASDIMGDLFTYERLVLVGALFVLVLPLCLLRSISKLASASFINIIFVFVIVVIVGVQSPKYNAYMNDLSQAKIIANEQKLETDRTVWVCAKVNSGAGLYDDVSPEFSLRKVTNAAPLYDYLRLQNACGAKASKTAVNNALRSFVGALSFGEDPPLAAAKPSSWLEVVQYAHAGELFTKYSLQQRVESKVTAAGIFNIMGIYATTFFIQQGTFGIFRQLQRKTVSEWRLVQGVGFVLVYALNLSMALIGYMYQREIVGDTIFDKLKLRFFDAGENLDITINVGRILLAVTIFLTYPMLFYFARRNLFIIFIKLLNTFTDKDYDVLQPPGAYFYPISVALFGIATVIGVYLNQITVVYSISGSLLVAPMAFVLPSLCYFRSYGSIKQHFKKSFGNGFRRILLDVVLPTTVAIFGVFMTIVSTTLAIINL